MKFDKNDTLAIKGIAILLMIQHHGFLSPDRFEGMTVSFTPFSQTFIVTISNFFKICVGMYVFLSGYGLTVSLKKYGNESTLSGRQYKDYLYRRLWKLMAGFWVIYILGFIFSLFINERVASVYFTKDITTAIYSIFADAAGLAYLFNTPTLNGTWWYMTLAIFIILVLPFIANMSKKYGPVLVMLLCIFVPRIISFYVQLQPDSKANISRWFFAVVLGIVFAQYDVMARLKGFMITKNKYISKAIKFVLLTALLVGLYYMRVMLHKKGYSANAYELTDSVIPVFVVYYCYEFIVGIPGLRQVLCFLGTHSMNIFLLHTFIRQYFLREFVYSVRHFALVTLLVLVLSLAISVVIELIKKYSGFNKFVGFVDKKIAGKEALYAGV